MQKQEFVDSIKLVLIDNSLKGIESFLKQPPGRTPSELRVKLSEWYNSLDDISKDMVLNVAKEALHTAIFGFFCILDGVSTIEEMGEKGEFRLTYISPAGEETIINDEESEYLHNLLNSLR
jgi:hypothetical protein